MSQQEQQQRLGAFYLDQSTLQCKAGCGFFGNPEWLGYCSICFKQLNNYQQQQQQHLYYQQQQQQIQIQEQQQQQRRFQQQQQQSILDARNQQLRSEIQALRKTIISKPSSDINSVSPSNETLNSGDQTSASSSATITNTGSNTNSPGGASSPLSPGNLFSNITSPSSIVMMGYDTLTNLHNTIMNTAKSSFRGSPNASTDGVDSSSVHSTSQSEYQMRPKSRKQWPNIINNASSGGRKASLDQMHFLYDVAWVDCLNHTNRFAKEYLAIERRPDKSINDLSELVHEFYEKMTQRFESQLIYKGASSDQLELLNDNMERILNEHIYHVTSARIINEDEDHNMAIQRRIRSLNWITVEHLEIEIDFQRPIVHDLLDKAICQMVEMNSRTSSIDKLECIVQCSKTIFELIQHGQPRGANTTIPASADQFLPVLVFVVIQANPPMLPADVKFLTRFSNPRRLMSGETGYYFTNLCCALEFIEKASGASLNLSEQEFNRYMSGEAIPETKSQFHTYLCDGLRTMCSNDAALKELKQRNETRQERIENLLEQIDVHLETNKAKLAEVQKYSQSLQKKLEPQLPQFYLDLKEKNKELASRLVPSQLRHSI